MRHPVLSLTYSGFLIGLARDLGSRFTGPSPALPIDALRVAVGVLAFVWNVENLRDLAFTSAPGGLIDHGLVAEIMPFTRWGLFQPGTPAWVFPVVFGTSCLLSLLLVAGVRPRTCALVLYVFAVSTYRWNFIVTYVEDAIVHQLLLWCALLPVGTTLTLGGWLRHRGNCWTRWRAARVPGAVVHCFALSMVLLYLFAGGWKWTSPAWLDGHAMWSIMNLPIALAPDSWNESHIPLLRVVTYAALVVEAPLALLWVLPPRFWWTKRVLLVAAIGLHGGILATMRLPLANLACLAALFVAFRWELTGQSPPEVVPRRGLTWHQRVAVCLVVLMCLAGLRGVPVLGAAHEPAYAGLWAVGVVLEYRLFDWIDLTNVHVEYDVTLKPPDAPARTLDPGEVFPAGNRSMLLQAYLHNLVWMPVPTEDRARLKSSIYRRLAKRFASTHSDGVVFIHTTRQRVTPENRALDLGSRSLLFAFRVDDGVVTMLTEDLSRARPKSREPKTRVR